MNTTLMNFHIPRHLKSTLDKLSSYKRVSRTAILNNLLEQYCRKEIRLIKEDATITDRLVQVEPKVPKKKHQRATSTWESSYLAEDEMMFEQLDELDDQRLIL